MANSDEECDIRPGTVTPKKLPKQSGGGGHEFVTELPETGDEGVEYVLMDDFSDCSTYRGTFVWNEDCGGWIQTSGSGGGAIERYTFEQTATGWRAKRNNTVIFTYVDKDTIDSYENTADGFQITRNGVVIFTHTDGGGGDCKEYTITSTDDGWVFKEDGVTKFTYTEPANDPSDGTYFTSGTLTTAITGTTTVAASSVTGLTLADVVIGETLIYDEAGSVGRVTAVSGTNLTVETITTAPGERRGTRLGAVDDYTDLPATCAAAVALGWQTPLAGDFAYVREDASHDDHLTEWVISNIDNSCNITWAYSHTLNAGNYVLDIYKYGDYPSGSPIPKNPDGSVTLPKDEDTTYDFETVMDGTDVKGWRVKDHDTGTVLYTYTDQDHNDNTTYDFEDVTVSGKVVGWRVKDHDTGTVLYTYTDLNDESDGTYFTSTTLDTDITDQTTVAASSVTGLTLSDVVIGETLIYDGAGTVGVVTAVSGTDLTVDTITVSGSGDASSYVYKTTGTFDTTVDNTTNVNLSTLTDASGNTPTASDIIIGKTLAWDDDGTVALAVAIADPSVTFKTMTLSGGGSGGTYVVDMDGEYVKSAYAKLDSNWTPSANATIPLVKKSGDFEQPSVGLFTVPDGMRIELAISVSQYPHGDVSFGLYNNTDSVFITDIARSDPWVKNNYFISSVNIAQWTNNTGHSVDISYRIVNISTTATYITMTHATIKEIGRVVDPVKYLDNSEGLQDTPVGNIISYMGNNVPRHYLACDGTVYNIGDYPALEAHFIEEFGSVNYFGGNGTTTWAVPDLQGEFLRGTGTNSHTNEGTGVAEGSGANVGVHQDATLVQNNTFIAKPSTAGTVAPTLIDVSKVHFDSSNGDSSPAYQGYVNLNGTRYNSQYGFVGTSRPTNTSVKYCIKYESTMQVILGADQYAVRGTYARNTALNTWQLNTLTATDGDTSLVKNGVFYAPEDGYYQLTANTGWANGSQLWMTWQKRADAMGSTNTQTETNKYMLLNNTGAPGGTNDAGVSREALSGAVWLNKGDPVTLQTYVGRALPDANGKYEWSIVRLTGSVDINEINLIAADDVYSTDEQLVGSFLGKPLYKKTYELPSGLSLSSTSWTNSGIAIPSDLDKLIKVEGQAAQGRSTTSNGAFAISGHCDNGVANYQLLAARDGNGATIYYFTAYYTKTSDAAGSAPTKNMLLINRPDLWTPGTEYDFGGGLYGQRVTGTITVAANTASNITLFTATAGAKLVDCGGNLVYNSNGDFMQLGYNQDTSYRSGLYGYVANGEFKLHSQTSGARTNAPYDIWVTYTK